MEINLSQEQIDQLVAELARPFDLADVKWVVKSTTQDGKKALVAPYADPRAYHQRLNEVLSASGWGNEYKTEIVSGLSRMAKGKLIQTGKVSTVCSLSIFALGSTKSATGEMWADDDNAVTRAEAQAFKRACAMFNLGTYFYRVKNGVDGVNLWVPYNSERKQITQSPRLPDWALNENDLNARRAKGGQQNQQRPANPTTQSQPQQGQSQQSQQPRQNGLQQVSQPQRSAATNTESRKQAHVQRLGQPLYASIVAEVEHRANAGSLKEDKFAFLEKILVAKEKLLAEVRTAAADMHTGALDSLLNRHQVKRLDLIPNFATLNNLAEELGVEMKKAA